MQKPNKSDDSAPISGNPKIQGLDNTPPSSPTPDKILPSTPSPIKTPPKFYFSSEPIPIPSFSPSKKTAGTSPTSSISSGRTRVPSSGEETLPLSPSPKRKRGKTERKRKNRSKKCDDIYQATSSRHYCKIHPSSSTDESSNEEDDWSF